MSWQPTPRIASIETHCGLNGPTRNALFLRHLEIWSRCSWTPATSAPRRPSRGKFGPRVEPTRLPLLCRKPLLRGLPVIRPMSLMSLMSLMACGQP